MNRREAFLKIFGSGISYERYVEITLNDKVKERMLTHYNVAKQLVETIGSENINRINKNIKVLVIGENWCGDCANGIPVIAALAERLDQWEFVISPKAPFEEELQLFYSTAGRVKIPVIVFADEDGDEIAKWVERPTRSYRLLAELQAKKLPKEEYLTQYRAIAELKAPSLTEEIFKELFETAERACALIQILPTKRQ